MQFIQLKWTKVANYDSILHTVQLINPFGTILATIDKIRCPFYSKSGIGDEVVQINCMKYMISLFALDMWSLMSDRPRLQLLIGLQISGRLVRNLHARFAHQDDEYRTDHDNKYRSPEQIGDRTG